jgi:hypothetical protein
MAFCLRTRLGVFFVDLLIIRSVALLQPQQKVVLTLEYLLRSLPLTNDCSGLLLPLLAYSLLRFNRSGPY